MSELHFGPPFVKRFALSYRTVVCLSCLSCLSVTLVHCGQTVGSIKMKLGMHVGFGPGHIGLYGDPAPPPSKGQSPQFSAHICCGQMAGWIKTPLGIEVGFDAGHIVLDGDPAPRPQKRKQSPKIFGPCLLWPNSRPSQLQLTECSINLIIFVWRLSTSLQTWAVDVNAMLQLEFIDAANSVAVT